MKKAEDSREAFVVAQAQALERIEARAKEHGSVDLARDLYQQQQGTRGRDEAGRVAVRNHTPLRDLLPLTLCLAWASIAI